MIRWRNISVPPTTRYVHSPMRSPRSSCGQYDWPRSSKATFSISTFDESLEDMDETESFLKPPSKASRKTRRTSSLVEPPTHLMQQQGSGASPDHWNRSLSTQLRRSTSLKRRVRYSSHDRELDRYYTSGVSLKRRNPLLAKVEKKGTGDSFSLFKKFFSKSIDEEDDIEQPAAGAYAVSYKNPYFMICTISNNLELHE